MSNGPIVVGGTGGSGTRLVAELLAWAGVYMGDGDTVNYAMDSMPMNRADMYYLHSQGNNLDEEIHRRVIEHHKGFAGSRRWGWKHTMSYLTLPMLHHYFPDMAFVHVIRDGRDMAYGEHTHLEVYGVWHPINPGPHTLIALWETTNLLCANYGERFIKGYCRVRYEDLCDRSHGTIAKLYDSLGLKAEPNTSLVRPSPTRGRWKSKPGISALTEIAGFSLRRFGYIA